MKKFSTFFGKNDAKVIKNTIKPSILNHYCKKTLQKLGT